MVLIVEYLVLLQLYQQLPPSLREGIRDVLIVCARACQGVADYFITQVGV